MKKIIALTAFVIIAVAIVYSSVNWDADKERTRTEYVTLSNGKQIALTEKEAALSVNSEEKKVALTDLGLSCMSCQAAVTSALKDIMGVKPSFVNLEQYRATVVYQPEVVTISEIKQSIIDVGFQVGDVKEVQSLIIFTNN